MNLDVGFSRSEGRISLKIKTLVDRLCGSHCLRICNAVIQYDHEKNAVSYCIFACLSFSMYSQIRIAPSVR
jgi:hypothetical protein